jgi:hypothetical protein
MDTSRSLTLYMIPDGDNQSIVTDHGFEVATVNGRQPSIRAAHELAERRTGAMVKLVAPIETAARSTGIVMVRATEDHDDPILSRLIRMIHRG